MSKTVSLFVYSNIVAAAVGAANASGAFVRSIVESRESLKSKNPSEEQIDECLVAMAAAFSKDGLSKDSLDGYSSVARRLLGCPFKVLVEACKDGMGRTGVYRRVNDAMKPADSTKPKRGRPAKQGAGKTTAPAVMTDSGGDPINPAPGESISPMHRWVVQANTLSAAAFMLRNAKNETMNTDDAKALQDAANLISALLGKYTK
jgi:hypothetical protein